MRQLFYYLIYQLRIHISWHSVKRLSQHQNVHCGVGNQQECARSCAASAGGVANVLDLHAALPHQELSQAGGIAPMPISVPTPALKRGNPVVIVGDLCDGSYRCLGRGAPS